nr:hypothetical protein CFP56_42267 [Quercus suber]
MSSIGRFENNVQDNINAVKPRLDKGTHGTGHVVLSKALQEYQMGQVHRMKNQYHDRRHGRVPVSRRLKIRADTSIRSLRPSNLLSGLVTKRRIMTVFPAICGQGSDLFAFPIQLAFGAFHSRCLCAAANTSNHDALPDVLPPGSFSVIRAQQARTCTVRPRRGRSKTAMKREWFSDSLQLIFCRVASSGAKSSGELDGGKARRRCKTRTGRSHRDNSERSDAGFPAALPPATEYARKRSPELCYPHVPGIDVLQMWSSATGMGQPPVSHRALVGRPMGTTARSSLFTDNPACIAWGDVANPLYSFLLHSQTEDLVPGAPKRSQVLTADIIEPVGDTITT